MRHAASSRKVGDAESRTDWGSKSNNANCSARGGESLVTGQSATDWRGLQISGSAHLCQIRPTSPCCFLKTIIRIVFVVIFLVYPVLLSWQMLRNYGITLMSCVPLELQWDWDIDERMVLYCRLNNSVSTPPAIQKLLKLETCKWVSKCSKQAMAHVGLILAGLRCR